MAKNYRDYKYFENRPDVVKIFDDLEAYLDWCRFEMQPYNPADLYRKDSPTYQSYLHSKRPRRPWVDRNNGERKPYQGNRPRHNDNFSR
jgi:hypothetical protein